MMRTRSTVLLTFLLMPAAIAQGDPQPKQFQGSLLPQNYTQEVYVDLDALQDTEVWDAVERSIVIPPLFQAFRKEFGYRFQDLMSIRMGGVRYQSKHGSGFYTVTVFKGSRPFKLPSLGKARGDRQVRKHDRIAGFPVVQQGKDRDPSSEFQHTFGPSLFVLPKSKVMVYGEKRVVEPILRGKARGGVPHPELMAFTAGSRPLAYAATQVSSWGEWDHAGPFKREWLTKVDPMTFMMARLHVDAKNDHSIVSMAVRFKDGRAGPAKLMKNLTRVLADASKDKRFAMFKNLIDKIAFKVDGTDLKVTLDLGGPKDVAKVMSASGVLPLLMWFSVRAESVDMTEVVEIVEEVELVKDDTEKKKPAKKDTKKKQ